MARVRHRRFKIKNLQQVYDWYLTNKPDPEEQKSKGAMGNAYYVGRSINQTRPFAIRGSLAYAAWAAGVDLNRMEKH